MHAQTAFHRKPMITVLLRWLVKGEGKVKRQNNLINASYLSPTPIYMTEVQSVCGLSDDMTSSP
jgi:hypothetical protein